MAVTSEGIAIAELIVYIPIALITIVVVLRHGFHKQLGWIYLSIFSVLRIAGAIMQILAHKNPDNENDKEWAIILQAVGLSPLLLSSLGLLKRVFDGTSTHIPNAKRNAILQTIGGFGLLGIVGKLVGIYNKRATATSRRSRIVQLLHIPALIALALAISGGSDEYSSNPSDHSSGKTETRVAILLFLAIYLALCLLWLVTVSDLSVMVSSQKRIFGAVFIALPLIAVRLLYSLISDFGHDAKFSLVDGDTGVQLGMATIEEFLIVLMYTVLGVITPRVTEEGPRYEDEGVEYGNVQREAAQQAYYQERR